MKSLDESHQRRRIQEVQQAFLALLSGIDHRARKSGLPHQRGKAGDLFAEAKIMVPEKLSPAERELFEQLAAASTFDPRDPRRRR